MERDGVLEKHLWSREGIAMYEVSLLGAGEWGGRLGYRARTFIDGGKFDDPEDRKMQGGRLVEVVVNGPGYNKALAKFNRIRADERKRGTDIDYSLLTSGLRHPTRRRKPKKQW